MGGDGTLRIRSRTPADLQALGRVLEEQRPHTGYPQTWPLRYPVDRFIARANELAAWVAELDGEVVGHACASPARLVDDPDSAVGFGPLGVLPAHQRAGVGSALVHATVGAANALGYGLIVLLGSPAYYRRFGFVPASGLGITPPVAEWTPHFQARPLAAHTADSRGAFRYAPAFDRL